MPLAIDVISYLAGISALSLSTGTTSADPNAFAVPFPEASQDQAVCLIEYPGEAAEHAAGPSLTAPLYENPRFQIVVRDAEGNAATCRALAESINVNLDGLSDTTLSGTRYLQVRQVSGPFYLPPNDGRNRHRYATNYKAEKVRG